MLRLYENQGRLTFFHPANGGSRSRAEAGIFKAMGVKAGVPDLVILWRTPLGPAHGYIEVKAGKGKLTDSQVAWRDLCHRWDIPWAELRDAAELPAILKDWGVLP